VDAPDRSSMGVKLPGPLRGDGRSAPPLRAGQPHVAVPRIPAWRARAGRGASGPVAAWSEGSVNPPEPQRWPPAASSHRVCGG